MRKVGIGFALLIVLVAAVAYYLTTNLNPLVESAIEKYGSQITGVAVTVDSVDISLKYGAGSIRGLRVANPPGFEGAPAFELGEIKVDIDLATLGQAATTINEILIEAPKINVIANNKAQTNIDVIRQNAEKNAGGSQAPSEPEATEPTADPLLRIGKLTFADATLAVDLTQAGGSSYETTLPALHQENLGGTNGATPAAIAQEITKTVTQAITRELAQAGANEFIDRHLEGENAEAVKGALRGLMKLKDN